MTQTLFTEIVVSIVIGRNKKKTVLNFEKVKDIRKF